VGQKLLNELQPFFDPGHEPVADPPDEKSAALTQHAPSQTAAQQRRQQDRG
jgi:hypothetical protein